ncbi:MAG: type II toxin-antitoxin system VapC family toxin [Magnetococcales bacterium]|nr:type II toxin-antitoxin system VapC family toxin [Magnetococcales bacterium]MBF0150964.1 type II toxin-antitoxin system VapC family toxin [Magnetococcales bacterium]MBF0172250.1 type II toxin-antitoxin system VapC family toxin [Magnetococcales bacterium]MBF0346252.1 type II toxin-antitoxin system VapC family toxin [Magnetococcales bacterium]MBF0631531.1 type II toxin-antitoxin system VapC family toxin [Magnetococcales bacterium]
MVVNHVLDTNIVLSLLGGQLAEPLPVRQYFASTITEIELLSYPSLSQSEESKIRALLHDIRVVDIDPDIKEKTIRLRRYQGLKLPDAIIAATAFSLNGILLTNDQKIARVPGLQCQSVPLKGS